MNAEFVGIPLSPFFGKHTGQQKSSIAQQGGPRIQFTYL